MSQFQHWSQRVSQQFNKDSFMVNSHWWSVSVNKKWNTDAVFQ
jgi:hypothetical protein